MKVSTVLLAATSAVSVSAGPSWIQGGNQVVINEDFKVPGDNPLYFCADPKDYLLDIENVDLDPNPPLPGQTLSITAKGDFKKQVEEGSKMHLTVRYNNLITLINQDADTCETVKKADLECPLKKGEMKLTKDVDLPQQIPPGKYNVKAEVKTKDGDDITCLTAEITFHR
ncbi:Phosphatidylglycerol/phosphatidylinositol transfer protein [Paraconiothyrium brasiliense]|uniref:Phosphatidylglycerol/phosphatidylinositol transfer protein n=1 Tax=Paraconiothyrium brasiliense TaxID=300254 RepID=A0ABR3QK39_9PLEO